MKYFMTIIATLFLSFGFIACGDKEEDTACDTAVDSGVEDAGEAQDTGDTADTGDTQDSGEASDTGAADTGN